ncbi:MAG: hypothetical protein DRH23_07710 [Deltaproteobacteria bacterium]|nr:MAG: hypothetical protein DRH23_07710 [Deltaproteobacteria bacterium]
MRDLDNMNRTARQWTIEQCGDDSSTRIVNLSLPSTAHPYMSTVRLLGAAVRRQHPTQLGHRQFFE